MKGALAPTEARNCMPPDRRRARDDCTAPIAVEARVIVESRCSPDTCRPACRESSTSEAAEAAMSAMGLPAKSSDSAILPMSLIDLAPRKDSRNRSELLLRALNSKSLMINSIQERIEQA